MGVGRLGSSLIDHVRLCAADSKDLSEGVGRGCEPFHVVAVLPGRFSLAALWNSYSGQNYNCVKRRLLSDPDCGNRIVC